MQKKQHFQNAVLSGGLWGAQSITQLLSTFSSAIVQ